MYRYSDTLTMNRKEFIAYKGVQFTIEWYFGKNGQSQALEYFYMLNNTQKRKLLMLFKRIGDFGIISDKTKFRNEHDGIYAFKPQPDRFLSFFTIDKRIIITEGFNKKSNKLPVNIKKRSVLFKLDYTHRVKEDTYYG